MKIGSLFTGYGGLDMAVQQMTGGGTVWVSDIDKGACKILSHRYPNVPNLGDISEVDWAAVEPVDILTGGFPCQDVSHAGQRKGIRPGTRSGLWTQMCYAIEQLGPELVVIENVRGLLSASAHSNMEPCPWCVGDGSGQSALRALGAVLGDLADIGYDARWCGLRAADIGAPHGRFRIFIIAQPSDTDYGRCGERHPQIGGPSIPHKDCDQPVTPLLPTPVAAEGVKPSNSMGVDRRLETGQVFLTNVVVSQFGDDVTEINKLGTHGTWGDYAPAVERWERVNGPAPAPTLVGRNGTGMLSQKLVEWMMGLPAGWVTDVPGITRNEALKALGNGVVPQQACEALRRLFLCR